MVFGSQSTIAQVLVNLFVNAVSAVRTVEEQRQPEICLSTWVDGDQVFVSVRDNGTGIDPAIQTETVSIRFSRPRTPVKEWDSDWLSAIETLIITVVH